PDVTSSGLPDPVSASHNASTARRSVHAMRCLAGRDELQAHRMVLQQLPDVLAQLGERSRRGSFRRRQIRFLCDRKAMTLVDGQVVHRDI
ncbi:hypothetical protein MOQ72_40280, partial [Saccharopolyspora sp. K220]|uniref:hypothetical protein n=1 Tax=Saccharopolyspora soli TaxID=2926618 RepID=UPI001F56918C